MNTLRAPVHARVIAMVAAVSFLVVGCARRPVSPWQAIQVPTDADFTGLWFSDSLNGWLTGGGWAIEGGIVGRTRDGGRTWRFESGLLGSEKGAALGRVQFRDSLRGCVTVAYGEVLVTDDGGTRWRPAGIPGIRSGTLFDIQFLDRWTGWAAGTRVLHTEDGGESWRTRFISASENGYLVANAIHFVDESRGWLVSHGGTLARTEDGGSHWEQVPLPLRQGERPTLWDVTFVDARNGWLAGERGNIFRTRDGGTSWQLEDNGVPVVRVIPKGEPRRPRDIVPELGVEPDRLALSAIQFADSEHGWAAGYYADVAESVVLRTDDGGESWVTEHVQPGELLRSLFVLDRDHAWAAGDRARTEPQVVLRFSRDVR